VDNWRRYSDVMAQLQDNVPTDARGNPATLIVDEAVAFSYDGLLAQLPLTDEKKQQSNDSIANALYTAGRLYTDNIEDYESAIQTYEELRRRFPAFENGEEVLFQLYYSYTKTGNRAKAAEVKALLEKNYPGGRFTGIATTGTDAANTTAGNKEATKAYEAVYDLFLEGRFDEARSAKDAADAAYGTTTWQPQLLYIEAVYHIKQGADSAAKQTLETLIAQNGDSPISEKATTLLDVLSRRREIEKELNELQIERPVEEAPYIEPDRVVTAKANRMAVDTAVVKKDLVLDKPIALRRDTLVTKPIVLPNKPKVFTYQPAETHFAVVLLNKVDVVFGNEARNAFARYNREKYYNRTLELSVIPLNDDVKLLVIGRFENVQGALDYVQKAKPISATEIMPWLKGDKYSFSLISESNLQLLQENGDLPGYQAFLDKNLPVKF
jgi:outer membrane protein assembly factor BamD (BamD/ComL family)